MRDNDWIIVAEKKPNEIKVTSTEMTVIFDALESAGETQKSSSKVVRTMGQLIKLEIIFLSSSLVADWIKVPLYCATVCLEIVYDSSFRAVIVDLLLQLIQFNHTEIERRELTNSSYFGSLELNQRCK